MPTTRGSRWFAGRPPVERDAIHVARLRAAGAIPIGKTAAPEFGTWAYTASPALGVTRNPWDPARTPGGSSGGSSAAVSAGMVPFCTASDGAGRSAPRPLHRLVGLKCYYGRIPTFDVTYLAQNAVVGSLTTTVADTALLDVMAGPDERDRTPAATRPRLPRRHRPDRAGREDAGGVVGRPRLRRRRTGGGRAGPRRRGRPRRGRRPHARRSPRRARGLHRHLRPDGGRGPVRRDRAGALAGPARRAGPARGPAALDEHRHAARSGPPRSRGGARPPWRKCLFEDTTCCSPRCPPCRRSPRGPDADGGRRRVRARRHGRAHPMLANLVNLPAISVPLG